MGAYVVMAASSVSAAVSAVGLPLHLNATGLDKNQIAIFFVVGAAIAIAYNTLLIPRIVARGYSPTILRASCAAVPVGLFLISIGAIVPWVLYLGGGLMLLTTMTFPQVLGRVSRSASADEQESVVAHFRQVMVAGYIGGLGVLAITESLGLDALVVAAGAAIIAATGTWARSLSARLPISKAIPPTGPRRSRGLQRLLALAVIVPVVLIGLMKAIDALRSIYLPLYAKAEGAPTALIPLLFAVCAMAELLLLPLLARASRRFGATPVLIAVSAAGAASFGMLIVWNSTAGMVAAQLIYAIFAAGFQSIGLVVLSRAVGRGAGVGAGIYVSVIQVGTMLGAVLPLLVSGYSANIFLIAAVISLVCVALSVAVRWSVRRITTMDTGDLAPV